MKDSDIRAGIKRLRGEVPTGDVYERCADGRYRKEVAAAPWPGPIPAAPSRPHDWRQMQHDVVRGMTGKTRLCLACDDTGHVCENHSDRPWDGVSNADNACGCGAGMPCRACCEPVPQDGTHHIADAFTPRAEREKS